MIADQPLAPRRWEGEDRPLTVESLNGLLAWATAAEASDIRLQTGKRIILQVHGRVVKIGERRLIKEDMETAADTLRGADAMVQIKSGQDFDVAYEIKPDRKTRLRFRVNGKGAYARGADGVALVCRTMPLETWPLARQDVDPRIMDAFRPREGMVLVVGPTGSGKTRLLGGMTRAMLEDPGSNKVITELAAPIENLFDDIDAAAAEITQLEIGPGSQLPTFAAGIRNLMRSACNTAIVGECRDSETMDAAIQAALADHALYTTLHAARPREAVQRAVSLCPPDRRAALTVALAQALRLIVAQRLIFSADGRRTPIREFLVLDQQTRRRLADADPLQWPNMVQAWVEERGTTFAASIRTALAEGRITEETAREELRHVA